jgi:predicted aspartyl protease
MSTFTVQGILSHPERRDGQRVVVDLLVGTRATYMVLPAEIVEQLALATPDERAVELATGERAVYPLGSVRLALAGEEWVTVFLAGPRGSPPRLGTVTLTHFALVVDSANRRLVRMPHVLLMSA